MMVPSGIRCAICAVVIPSGRTVCRLLLRATIEELLILTVSLSLVFDALESFAAVSTLVMAYWTAATSNKRVF